MQASEVLKQIKAATSGPAGFGFGIGGPDNVLVVERGRAAAQMSAQAKKHPGVKQSCGGTVIWNGSVATFASEQPLPGLEKLLDGWVRANKLTLKFSVLAGKAAIQKAEAEAAEGEEEEDGNALFSAAQIERRIKQSKTKDMFFAFGPAGGKGEDLLALHPLKDGEKLFRMIKAENGAVKKAWGTASLDGALVTFTCAEKPFPALKRSLRALFKEWKFAYRILIIGPEGEVGEEDDEGVEAEGEAGLAETRGIDDKVAAHLEAVKTKLAAAKPELVSLAKAIPREAATIGGDLKACEQAIAKGDAAGADAEFLKLGQLVRSLRQQLAAVATLRAELDKLMPALRHVAERPGMRDAVRGAHRKCDSALLASEVEPARRFIAELRKLVEAPQSETPPLDLGRIRDLVAMFNDALSDLGSRVDKLQKALRDTGDDNMIRIADEGLPDVTKGMRTAVSRVLLDLLKAPAGQRRSKASAAQAACRQFAQVIKENPVFTMIDENPFGVKVDSRSSLTKMLGHLHGELKALAA